MAKWYWKVEPAGKKTIHLSEYDLARGGLACRARVLAWARAEIPATILVWESRKPGMSITEWPRVWEWGELGKGGRGRGRKNTSYSFPRTLLLFRSSQSPQFARTKMAAETIGWIYPLSTKTPALQARGGQIQANSIQLQPGVGWSWLEFEVPFGRPRLNLSLLRVIDFKIPLQPHQKYNITQYEVLGFS